MTAKHTPGPWTTIPCSNGGLLVIRGKEGKHMQSHIQVIPKSDAYLIATAPELLEACKAVVTWYENAGNADPAPGSVELWSLCRKAIAKAEGRK